MLCECYVGFDSSLGLQQSKVTASSCFRSVSLASVSLLPLDRSHGQKLDLLAVPRIVATSRLRMLPVFDGISLFATSTPPYPQLEIRVNAKVQPDSRDGFSNAS